jgi:hypothetical protein
VTEPELLTVTRTQGNNEALKTGAVTPHGFRFAFEEVPVLIHAFRRMARGLEFDLCEMALTTYLVAKAHGVAFTAVPVFLVRGFHHGAIHRSTASDIRTPKDLEGRKVGVSRGYTVTTGVWALSVLHDEYGVDLSTVTWVLSGDEHVAQYRPPGNVVAAEEGTMLDEMLARGGDRPGNRGPRRHTVDPRPAGSGLPSDAAARPLPDQPPRRDQGQVLRARPEVATEVFDAFARAKRLYVERLRGGAITNPTATDRLYARVMESTGSDPLPYGITPNRKTLDELLRSAVDQKILDRPPAIEDVFARATLDLIA